MYYTVFILTTFSSVQTLSLREALETDEIPDDQASPSCAPWTAPIDYNGALSQGQCKQSRDSNAMKP